ncbi:MAG TPA: glutathione peroxidase [Bacteroidota bacterium]|nr:glutathione peroxidase [Bacteroidota bacterium]
MHTKGNVSARPGIILGAIIILAGVIMASSIAGENAPTGVLGFTMKSIDGKQVPLSQYKGKVLLLVNVASECGFTPQYKDLEALYRKYEDRGFMILGFPANNFGGQEPGSDSEIKSFCTTTYGVTFDMFSKISVKGDDQHPLYKLITSDPKYGGEVRWNFQKYLVDRNGVIIGKYLSKVGPLSTELTSAIETALGN